MTDTTNTGGWLGTLARGLLSLLNSGVQQAQQPVGPAKAPAATFPPARPLPLGAIDRAAQSLGCSPAALIAVLTVETGNKSGFLADGSGRPVILYEAHIAYRLNGGVAVPGLAVPKWDRSLYAPTAAGEWKRLEQAASHPKIGQEAAWKAASWGLGQVLGTNHALCGFNTVAGFVQAMKVSEEDQLAAVLEFIRSNGLAGALKRLDWAAFARGYNGTAYAANSYDTKLTAAYRKAAAGTPDDGTLSVGDFGAEVAALQRALAKMSFAITVDGSYGPKTRTAVERVQVANNLPVTGVVDHATAAALGVG